MLMLPDIIYLETEDMKMLNIYSFINSKDISAYLREIGYQFNSLEAAWLICQCKDMTQEERHAAWKELIETICHGRVSGYSFEL